MHGVTVSFIAPDDVELSMYSGDGRNASVNEFLFPLLVLVFRPREFHRIENEDDGRVALAFRFSRSTRLRRIISPFLQSRA